MSFMSFLQILYDLINIFYHHIKSPSFDERCQEKKLTKPGRYHVSGDDGG